MDFSVQTLATRVVADDVPHLAVSLLLLEVKVFECYDSLNVINCFDVFRHAAFKISCF